MFCFKKNLKSPRDRPRYYTRALLIIQATSTTLYTRIAITTEAQ